VTDQSLEFRPFTAEELPAALALLGWAFADDFSDDDLTAEASVHEPERSQAAFDGDTIVGSLGSYTHRLSVPGGEVPMAGTTWVSVAPTHRRRGVLREMMTRHLHDVREAGEPLAGLWASEAAIYGRFGYGMATEQHILTVGVKGLAWEATAPPPADRVRIVPLEEAPEVLAPIYQRCRERRGGMHARSRDWWFFQVLSTRKAAMNGMTYKRVAVASVDGEDVAYAVYGAKDQWGDDGHAGVLSVHEMVGVDAHAEAAMWRYLAGHDLIGSIKAWRRPVDDPLPLLVTDSRRVQQAVSDALYLRVIDVPAALRARSWSDSAGVTIEVVDDVFAHNDGTWRVEVAPEGVSVEPTDDAPDLRMPVKALGSLYLGGVSVSRLAAAGLVEVTDPTAVASLDAALRPAEAPWIPEVW